MSISEIKKQLSIEAVLSYYGLSYDRNKMLSCPFHADGKASMRVYPETNTVYCFAGSCEVGSLDVIDFIMQMDKCSKREAILKAKSLCDTHYSTSYPILKSSIKSPIKTSVKNKKVMKASNPGPVLSKLFKSYQKSLHNHKLSQEYCASRCLDWRQLEIGYRSEKSRDALGKWGRGCIIFPLQDRAGEIVSFYGRSIQREGHYYQEGRRGLYPGYPTDTTRVLLLCESVIDAATLCTLDLGEEGLSVLAMYGTNGLTEEHIEVIEHLPELEEVVFMLDGDIAGAGATAAYGLQLGRMYEDLKLSYVQLVDGEDVNSLAVGHEDREGLFKELLLNRKMMDISGLSSKESQASSGGGLVGKGVTLHRGLNTSNPYNLIYDGRVAVYYVKGGVRYGEKDLDSLKVTLVVENEGGRKSRNKLDLYEDKQVEKVSRYVGEKLGLRADEVELDIQSMTDEVEAYQRKRYETHRGDGGGGSKPVVMLSTKEKQLAIVFLKKGNLLAGINELIGQSGIVGEEMNRLLLFVVASSYKMPQTLHALIQGSSGSGKTRLLKVIRELMPEEDVKSYTRVTDGSMYNQGEYFFKNKLLCFEDIDGLKEEALLAVRELQSNEILITSSSGKDSDGNVKGREIIVRGPIGSISCTTRAEVYEDNISRCFVIAVDESVDQDERIIQYQNECRAGLVDKGCQKEIKNLLQNCIRLLKPYEVINPYAHKISLPREAHKIRRLNELYQSFVCQITLLHQYQRKVDGKGRLVSEKEDLELACEILFESIVLKVDELDGSLRQFYEKLKGYVKGKGSNYKSYEFSRFEVREVTKVSKTQQHRYLTKLIELEYIRQYGFANRGYRYKIAYWDDYKALRSRIKSSLLEQIKRL